MQAKSMAKDQAEREGIEIQVLLEQLFRCYGYDFREYSRASLRRRVWNVVRSEGLPTISALTEKVVHDADCLERLLLGLSVNVSSMFRDPAFFLALREQVVPLLRTYPFIRVWNAGCSTGEEAYSVAILLHEEGLYSRSRIYATDMNASVLKRARDGIFSLGSMREYTHNYLKSGGTSSFSEYYTAGHGNAVFHPSLKENVVFSQHNLVTDGSFNEFHLILCRNVMIYFTSPLQDRVHKLLYESLVVFGILGLGAKESLEFTPHQPHYMRLESGQKLYRRVI
jgi:chemotaxis protein methyltransferase CheR